MEVDAVTIAQECETQGRWAAGFTDSGSTDSGSTDICSVDACPTDAGITDACPTEGPIPATPLNMNSGHAGAFWRSCAIVRGFVQMNGRLPTRSDTIRNIVGDSITYDHYRSIIRPYYDGTMEQGKHQCIDSISPMFEEHKTFDALEFYVCYNGLVEFVKTQRRLPYAADAAGSTVFFKSWCIKLLELYAGNTLMGWKIQKMNEVRGWTWDHRNPLFTLMTPCPWAKQVHGRRMGRPRYLTGCSPPVIALAADK